MDPVSPKAHGYPWELQRNEREREAGATNQCARLHSSQGKFPKLTLFFSQLFGHRKACSHFASSCRWTCSPRHSSSHTSFKIYLLKTSFSFILRRLLQVFIFHSKLFSLSFITFLPIFVSCLEHLTNIVLHIFVFLCPPFCKPDTFYSTLFLSFFISSSSNVIPLWKRNGWGKSHGKTLPSSMTRRDHFCLYIYCIFRIKHIRSDSRGICNCSCITTFLCLTSLQIMKFYRTTRPHTTWSRLNK